MVKLVAPPTAGKHPRGWNTNLGHQRKLRSYQVEETWYREHAVVSDSWRTARFAGATSESNTLLLVLEDLNAAGFSLRKESVDLKEMKACLAWLAHFHAAHLGKEPRGLWEEGTYWHLDTRPEELQVMREGPLKENAGRIDQALKNCRFRTFVHGDAKLANFCFSEKGGVAAVDFQYVGGGCGMKDVAYFISSCLYEEDCETFEEELLNFYFEELRWGTQLDAAQFDALEAEWRKMYPVAWADFVRFLEGWMPTHRKLHPYSRKMVRRVLEEIK